MSPEFIEKWERLLEDVDKQRIPVEFIKKIILKLVGRKQHTINIQRLLDQGLYPDEIEEAISTKLIELDELVVGIEFILNVESIAETVQPETDRILNGL
jgi:hypothetical protein